MSECSAEDIAQFVNVMKSFTAYDFSDYSDKSLRRRLSKVLFDNRLDLHGLLTEIQHNPQFVEKVVKEITVNTSEMFRDPQVWQAYRQHVIPNYKDQPSFDVWHSGCSTGQEVYTHLILLSEMKMYEKTNVYATDLNVDVIEAARKGHYKYRFNMNYLENFDKVIREDPHTGEKIDVPYTKYMDIDKSRDTIRIHENLCKKPVYHKHDLVKEDNIFNMQFDVIFCRNVIIYFNTHLQNKVFHLFYNSLKPNGCLILGLHETILGPYSGNFDKKEHFFYFKK